MFATAAKLPVIVGYLFDMIALCLCGACWYWVYLFWTVNLELWEKYKAKQTNKQNFSEKEQGEHCAKYSLVRGGPSSYNIQEYFNFSFQ